MDPQDYDDVSVVMITRNEEGAIAKVVDEARMALPGCDVIVVDGSSDRTPEIAKEHGAKVFVEPAGGPAPALLFALRASTRPIVVTVDADDTYPADIFPELVRRVREGDDVVGTNRLGRRPPKAMPLRNWLANVL
ncbi:MAG TPA: glycosyltransferase family 2 protein, partial [Acidimicrobiales bacterium]|nr:glycosyltransferase family 2 protein [Acidimicrobiales bacterium]